MISIVACGDVGVRRTDCTSMFDGCRTALQAADLCFAQLETTVGERGSRAPNAKLAMQAPPAMAEALREAGIGVVSSAGNHCLDFGYAGLHDTLQHVRAAGLAVCGTGEQLEAAREPARCSARGQRVALLAASAILPEGYAAEPDKPGCAPLRVFTVYEPIEVDQPGTPPRVHTFAHREDLQALSLRVQQLRDSADVVLVSLHWGIHMVPHELARYQPQVAHALIDAGADAILGHHPHLLKGIEIYRGKPIFYSLGNFAIEQPHIWDPAILRTASFRHLVSLHPEWDLTRRYMLPENTRATGLAKLLIDADGRVDCRFCPAWIDDGSVPRMLGATDPQFQTVQRFLQASCSAAGFQTSFTVLGDELQMS